MTTIPMSNTRNVIRDHAKANGWDLAGETTYDDHFERPAAFTDAQARMVATLPADEQYSARERVHVAYNGRFAIYQGYWMGPGQQAVLTGQFVDVGEETLGGGKKDRVIGWLNREPVTN